jgi:tRNA A37 threonylcarbamoyltransferase TsaD
MESHVSDGLGVVLQRRVRLVAQVQVEPRHTPVCAAHQQVVAARVHRQAGERPAAGLQLLVAPPALCTDNAAMIAYVAALKLENGAVSSLEAEIEPSLKFSSWLKA